MNYIEVSFQIEALDSAEISTDTVRDILVAELGAIFFESFVHTDNGLQAYIQEYDFSLSTVQDLYIFDNIDFEISMDVKVIAPQNWNAEWKKSFSPINVMGKCIIRAPFHDKEDVDYDILIEPKMSFGTGHHETPFQMISHLLNINVYEMRVLDMGCGTGVLAILACMKGAKAITAIDIDQWAFKNTLENIRKNKCSQIIVKHGGTDQMGSIQYDLILANINRNILIHDMEIYVRSMSSASKIIFSGFYTSDIRSIDEKARELGLRLLGQSEKNLWASLVYQKN
jgi:ribosomal protein L11 methyltransferase